MIIDIYCFKYDTTSGKAVFSGIIDNFISFTFTRSYSGSGAFTLVVDGDLPQAKHLLDSDFIRPSEGVCGLITATNESRGDSGATLTVTGQELKYLAIKRIVVPPAGCSHLELRGLEPSRVIQRLLETQLTRAKDQTRIIPGIVKADESAVTGELIAYKGRYSELYDDIVTICETYGIGWYADIEDGIITWHVYRGIDRTAAQSVNNRLLLAYFYDTISASSLEASRHISNVGVVAGAGEGVDRAIVMVGDSSGFDRTEAFFDARDIAAPATPTAPDIPSRYSEPENPQNEIAALREQYGYENETINAYIDALKAQYNEDYDAWYDNNAAWNDYDAALQAYNGGLINVQDELRARGLQKLAEYGDAYVMDITPSALLARNYRHGFDLGDMGTLLDVGVDFRLTEVTEIYESGSASLQYTYGYDAATLSAALKRMNGKFGSLLGNEGGT